ncbi:MAG TPA: calcium-binding protein [Solirubrobacteraceae bacterium]|nr:calcium-binding protein [Solirubrobacteraceae bacterium]
MTVSGPRAGRSATIVGPRRFYRARPPIKDDDVRTTRMPLLLTSMAAVVAALLLLPVTAGAAVVSVRPDPDSIDLDEGETSPADDEVYFAAASGERNRLLVSYAGDALSVIVSDSGAVVTPGPSCTSIDAHTVRCVPRTGGLSTFLQSVRADLGDLDDEVATTRPGPAPIGGVVANGGPGDDRLDGGAGPDRLDGGGGTDQLLGGAHHDVLTDGDRDGAVGEAAPGADVLDGGSGGDEISYRQRTAPVAVSIGDALPDGEEREGDVARGFEDVAGGDGDDRLDGDDRVNTLRGGGGSDVLIARGGRDRDGLGDRLDGGPGADRLSGGDDHDTLSGGSGVDRLSCGSGPDLVDDAQAGELLNRDCQRVRFSFGADDENFLSFSPHPRRTDRRSATFRLGCPVFEELDGEPSRCDGTLTFREASGQRRVLGRGRIADSGRRDLFDVRVVLTDLGRRRARTSKGVLATASIRGRNLPSVAWTIRLRVRRS